MWALRILSGPQAGKVFPLQPGKNKVGRQADCELVVPISGISKVHAEITVLSDKVLVTDLHSSNGTFLNGVRIQGGLLKLGDKMALGPVLFDFIRIQKERIYVPATVPQVGNFQQDSHGALAGADAGNEPQPMAQRQASWQDQIQRYLQNVVMPGVLSLTETFELKMILMAMVGLYIVLVTFLSMIPMKQITSESIQLESRRRALTIARALAQSNEKVLRSGDLSSFSTDIVLREEGIEDVYVVSREGNLLAPPERVGSTPKEIGFIRSIKGQTREVADTVGGRIAAAVPILGYDPELQQNVAKAYSVVVYNPGGLAFDDGRAFSLFIQMLALAFLLGAVLFFLMWNLIRYPLIKMNQELNSALQESRDHVQFVFQDENLQKFLVTLNSLLVRAMSAPSGASSTPVISRETEMMNLASLFVYPTVILNGQNRIVKANSPFEAMLSMSTGQLDVQSLDAIPDQALQKNIESLVETSRQNPDALAQDRLEMSGHFYALKCQALRSQSGEVEFFVVSIFPESAEQGSAA